MANTKISALASITTISQDDELVIVDTSETATKKVSLAQLRSNSDRYKNRIVVGSDGHFTTVKDAADWFNSSAVEHTAIYIDGGGYDISDTITINNATYDCMVCGLGSSITHLQAATGLAGKPMFNLKSNCDIRSLTLIGSTLASYGTGTANENAITFNTTTNIYSEITDIEIDNFTIGISDTIGSLKFIFNFIISNCLTGICTNYTTTGLTTDLDVEMGHFNKCGIGVDLLKADVGGFALSGLLFNNGPTSSAIRYNANYHLGDVTHIQNCEYNATGSFMTGFDFTLASQSNIEVLANVGQEDKIPYFKINVSGNTTVQVVNSTTAKSTYTNTISYASKWTITNNKATYLSKYKRDVMIWVSGSCTATSQPADIHVFICKNGDTANKYGYMNIYLDQNSRAFSFSMNAYIEDISINNYLELWIETTTNETLCIQDLNWLCRAN